jgi:hypothetical protein
MRRSLRRHVTWRKVVALSNGKERVSPKAMPSLERTDELLKTFEQSLAIF